jgi:UDP-GlcNAc:undecaprenyl-phosphate GlcNAc-1-phosphate transferase
VARKFEFFDIPDGKIKTHKKPVPYLGGLAVYFPFITALILFFSFGFQSFWLLFGATILLLLGLVDDIRFLSPFQKFLGQIFAVLCFLKGNFFFNLHSIPFWAKNFISGFWMLSVINAFNLVDVMDGLATILALISTLSILVVLIILKQHAFIFLLSALAGSLTAFLCYNRPAAKIYLGDTGSLFIGGIIAALSTLIPSHFHFTSLFLEMLIAIAIPSLLVGIPLIEVSSLVMIRKIKGLPFYSGSPHHFSSYLKNRNWSDYKILLFSTISAIFLSTLSIGFIFGKFSFLNLIATSLTFLVLWVFFIFLPFV